jgi:hypothetical protein
MIDIEAESPATGASPERSFDEQVIENLRCAVASGNRKSRHSKIKSEVTALSIAGIRVPEMKKAPSIYTVCYIKFIFNYSN